MKTIPERTAFGMTRTIRIAALIVMRRAESANWYWDLFKSEWVEKG